MGPIYLPSLCHNSSSISYSYYDIIVALGEVGHKGEEIKSFKGAFNQQRGWERPHHVGYLEGEWYSDILAAGAGISERPPVSGMGKKSAGPGIWEESIRYFVLGCRTDPTNAITRISVFRVILVCQGLIFCLWACIYPAWWASWNLPATPHCVGAATEAIMPGAVPGLVGMLWGEEFENSGILW